MYMYVRIEACARRGIFSGQFSMKMTGGDLFEGQVTKILKNKKNNKKLISVLLRDIVTVCVFVGF